MDPDSLSRPMQVLRLCLHLLVAVLLVLAVGRAIADGEPNRVAIVVVATVLALVYAAGAVLAPVRRSRTAAAGWLALLFLSWVGLLWLTPDATWLAFPLFLLQLHLLSAQWGSAAVALTTATAVTGVIAHRGFQTGAVIGPVLGAAVAVATVLGYQALYRESEQRRLLIEQLAATRAELATAEHTAGVLAERERLAREIHDTLAQGFSSIQLLLRAAQRALPDASGSAAEHIEQARRTAVENLDEARRFVRALSPPDLAGGTLTAALERLCASTTERSGLDVHLRLDGRPVSLPTLHEAALLRIAQSALSNATRHARARRAEMTLSYLDSGVALDIVDDGVGFDPEHVPDRDGGTFGLAAMRSRAGELGGTLAVESAPGEGTAISVRFPTSPVAG